MSDPNLKGESVEHRNRIANEIQRAINDGFSFIRKNHKLIHPETGKYIRVDVYAEKKDEIRIREVVCTHWSGHDPKNYLKTNKKVDFQVININPEGKSLGELKKQIKDTKKSKLVNFLLDEDIRGKVDEFCEKQQLSLSQFFRSAIFNYLENPIPHSNQQSENPSPNFDEFIKYQVEELEIRLDYWKRRLGSK